MLRGMEKKDRNERSEGDGGEENTGVGSGGLKRSSRRANEL